MPTYRFPVNGLRHHDFKDCLDKLYELAHGRRMSMSIEHDNAEESDAVIVYWGRKWVGYVRSGDDRERACALIEQSGRGSMLGRITEVDRGKRWLWLEVETDQAVSVVHEEKPNLLSHWTYDGATLPLDEEEHRLHAMLCNMEMTLEVHDPWDDDMEEWLAYVEENLWRDISSETYEQVKSLLALLTEGSGEHPEYTAVADRLQYAIDCLGSGEVRRKQAKQIIDKAQSDAMQLLMLNYGDSANEAILQLPDELTTLFLRDGETFMGRLWYLHRPAKQIRAIKTLLSMMVRLKDNQGHNASESIPRQWLLEWGRSQHDKDKAEFVQEVLSTYELEQSNPPLARMLAEMKGSCDVAANAAVNAEKQIAAIDRQTAALRDVAAKPSHYHASGSNYYDRSRQMSIGVAETNDKEQSKIPGK